MEVQLNGGIYHVFNDYASLRKWNDKSKDVKIPEKVNGVPVKTIKAYAFANNTSVHFVEMPSCIQKIEEHAFEFCTELESVKQAKIGMYPIQIHHNAFYSCYKLQNFSVAASIEMHDYAQFARCCGLNSFSALNIKKVPEACFAECENLSTFKFFSDVEIGRNAFVNCKNLKTITCLGDLNCDVSFLELLKQNNTEIECLADSNLTDLAYEGYNLKIKKLNFTSFSL